MNTNQDKKVPEKITKEVIEQNLHPVNQITINGVADLYTNLASMFGITIEKVNQIIDYLSPKEEDKEVKQTTQHQMNCPKLYGGECNCAPEHKEKPASNLDEMVGVGGGGDGGTSSTDKYKTR